MPLKDLSFHDSSLASTWTVIGHRPVKSRLPSKHYPSMSALVSYPNVGAGLASLVLNVPPGEEKWVSAASSCCQRI